MKCLGMVICWYCLLISLWVVFCIVGIVGMFFFCNCVMCVGRVG